MSRLADILAHLRSTSAGAPEYHEVIRLFIAVYDYLEQREETGIHVSAPSEHRLERIQGGLPVVSSEFITVDRKTFVIFLDGLLNVLKAEGKEGGEALDAIGAGFREERLDPAALFAAILGRNRAPLEEGAAERGIPAPLLEFVLEIPLKATLARYAASLAPEVVADWQERYCPVCGSRPGMAELIGEEGRRFLSCSCCAFRWRFHRLTCPSCGCADPEQLAYFTVGDGTVRVDTCKKCSRYIKTRDSRKGNDNVPLEAEDLLTIHLDLLASRAGYERGK